MASLMENLLTILEQENTEYQVLLELSRKKTSVIVGARVEELREITEIEQGIIEKLHNLELKREEYTADIANVINKDVEELKLDNLIRMLEKSPKEQKRLARISDELRDTIAQMRTVNAHNKELLDGAMEMVEFDLNILTAMRSAPQSANYNKGAYNTGSPLGSGMGSFDARQ